VLDLFQLDYMTDAHYLESKVLFGKLVSSYHDPAESACTYCVEQVKLFEAFIFFFFCFEVVLAAGALGSSVVLGFGGLGD